MRDAVAGGDADSAGACDVHYDGLRESERVPIHPRDESGGAQHRDNETEEEIMRYPVKQNEQGVDTEDRIQMLKSIYPTIKK